MVSEYLTLGNTALYAIPHSGGARAALLLLETPYTEVYQNSTCKLDTAGTKDNGVELTIKDHLDVEPAPSKAHL